MEIIIGTGVALLVVIVGGICISRLSNKRKRENDETAEPSPGSETHGIDDVPVAEAEPEKCIHGFEITGTMYCSICGMSDRGC